MRLVFGVVRLVFGVDILLAVVVEKLEEFGHVLGINFGLVVSLTFCDLLVGSFLKDVYPSRHNIRCGSLPSASLI